MIVILPLEQLVAYFPYQVRNFLLSDLSAEPFFLTKNNEITLKKKAGG